MSFDYFNTSHLAFGSKLTRAFRQLEKMCNDAELNISRYVKDIEYLGEYVNVNYRAAFPISPDSPVRADELFDVINDEIIIKEIKYDNNIFTVSINYFNRVNNRFTIGKGSTDLKEGFAFMADSVSNLNPTSEIKFVSTENQGRGKELFKFRVDASGFINIATNSNSIIKFNRGGINHINNMEIGDQVTLPHTASDYEAILVLGKTAVNGTSINLSLNNKKIYEMGGYVTKQYAIVYMKPEDILKSSTYDKAYKVIYNRTEET